MVASHPSQAQGPLAPRQSGSPLPDFKSPPVFETVLGLEFRPLKNWQVPHFGLFWERIKADFPAFQTKPPIGSPGPGPKAKLGEMVLAFEVTQIPPVRCWFLDESSTRLIQVQQDRFIHNWRKVTGQEEYPRYEDSIRLAFEREWPRFTGFLSDHGIDQPEILRCEVTYVNHFEQGREWTTLDDVPDVIRLLSRPETDSGLPVPERATLDVTYPLPKMGGSLQASLTPVIRHTDAKELLQFTLTAKVEPESSELGSLLSCFDVGREWVVNSFTHLTTQKMHELWGRIA